MDQQINEENIPEIMSKHFESIQKDKVKLTRLLGMTNKVYRVDVEEHDPYLFRILCGNTNH